MTSESGFLHREVRVGGVRRAYSLRIPEGAEGAQAAVLFLHGQGECGDDGQRQLRVGLPPAMVAHPSRWPCVAVFPQKVERDGDWFDERAYLDAVLAEVELACETDPSRRYLTGLSQGGHGTLRLAKHLSWRFAALVSVCGWCDVEEAVRELADVPLWAFHGARDKVVPAECSIAVVDALRAVGADARLTLYPEVGHDAWVPAFDDASLPQWLFAQRAR